MKKTIPKITLLALVATIITLNSCKKDPVRGCTDPESENYVQEATEDDGSCVYPYEKFVGTYNVHEIYSSDYCGNGTDDYTVVISKGSDNSEIRIYGLGGGMGHVTFDVDGTSITSPYQSAINSPLGLLDLDEGHGSISGNTIILVYKVDDILYNYTCGYINASATMTKQ